MIELDVWLDGIVSTCALIAEDGLFERVWLNGDVTITSIMNPDELFEQIFDDLDAENYIDTLSNEKIIDNNFLSLIRSFLVALAKFEKKYDEGKDNSDLVIMLRSTEWGALKSSAAEVVKYSRDTLMRSDK
ncbi:hypothetical protein QE250_16110 [Chromatiaceae bacterium AAb-1]|nr:hypothetical protein [Chromatiaceae bacterium AAb-1]